MGRTLEREIRQEGQGGVRDEICGGRAGFGLGARSRIKGEVRDKDRDKDKDKDKDRIKAADKGRDRVPVRLGGVQILRSWLGEKAVLGSGSR